MFNSQTNCGCNNSKAQIFDSPQQIVLQKGDNGWAPELANVIDGERVVQQIIDFTGGTGEKPTKDIGKYIGESGLVDNIADAVDIRGAVGPLVPVFEPIQSNELFDI